MDLGLKGVHVLVTGANGGIGVETTRLFLKQGARVSAHSRSNPTTLLDIFLEFGPDQVQTVQADLTKEEGVESAFRQARLIFGPVQVVIINHGACEAKYVPVKDMSLAQWNATVSTDLTSPFLVAREFLKGLDELEGIEARNEIAVVFVGSTAGKYGEAGNADYAACKSAMMYGLTLSLKNEIVKIAPKGRVNTVAPGWVYTPMAEESLKDPKIVYQSLSTTPLKKFAQPCDVATQIVVLSSSTISGHVTGQVVMVEGGMEGRLLNTPEDLA